MRVEVTGRLQISRACQHDYAAITHTSHNACRPLVDTPQCAQRERWFIVSWRLPCVGEDGADVADRFAVADGWRLVSRAIGCLSRAQSWGRLDMARYPEIDRF